MDKTLDSIVTQLEDNKALDIISIDLKGKSDIADFLVIATGTSNRHVGSLSENLITELKKDGSISIPLLAKKLNINASVLYSRIKRLIKKKMIKKFTIDIDESQLGFGVKAYVGINRDPKFKTEIHENLLEIPEIDRIIEVTGRFDLMVGALAEDLEQLHSIVVDKIGKIDGIQNTETFVELERTEKSPTYLSS